MNSPFHCSKTAKLREPPVQTGHLSPSLLDSSVTVTFGLQLFVFVHDFALERSFSLCFSLAIGSSASFFLLSYMHVLPGRQKSDTARCHWQREVNVIRRPLPRTTGRTSECLHAGSLLKFMRDVTEHVGMEKYCVAFFEPVSKYFSLILPQLPL